jgi:hypothetical protein
MSVQKWICLKIGHLTFCLFLVTTIIFPSRIALHNIIFFEGNTSVSSCIFVFFFEDIEYASVPHCDKDIQIAIAAQDGPLSFLDRLLEEVG